MMAQISVTMPFHRFRPNMAIRPVHRIKHVVDEQLAGALGVKNATAIIVAKDAPILNNTPEVEVGSKVNGIYLRVEVYATSSAALANCYFALFKSPGNNLIIPEPNIIGRNNNKRFVIHQEMVMLEQSTNGNPRTLFNGVIAIPRGLRRMGPDDTWYVIVLCPGVNWNQCLQGIYKEFR